MPRLARGDQAEVHGQFAGEVAPLGVLDHVDLADEVGDGHVGGGQLLPIAGVAADPGDGRGVAHDGDAVAGLAGDGGVGVVVDLRALDDRHGVVQQVDELPEHAGLGLAAEAQEQDVVLGEDRVLHLGDDGVFVPQDVGEDRLAGTDLGDEVAAHLVLDRLVLVAAGPQLSQRSRSLRRHRGGSPVDRRGAVGGPEAKARAEHVRPSGEGEWRVSVYARQPRGGSQRGAARAGDRGRSVAESRGEGDAHGRR